MYQRFARQQRPFFLSATHRRAGQPPACKLKFCMVLQLCVLFVAFPVEVVVLRLEQWNALELMISDVVFFFDLTSKEKESNRNHGENTEVRIIFVYVCIF